MIKFKLTFRKIPLTCYYITDKDEAKKAAAVIQTSAAEYLGLDFETAKKPGWEDYEPPKNRNGKPLGPLPGLCPHLSEIRLVQIYDERNIYVFDIWKTGLSPLDDLLRTRKFVAHNAVFEIKHLQHSGYLNCRVDCSMLVAILVDRAERSPFQEDDDIYEIPSDDNAPPVKRKYKRGYGLDTVIKNLFDVVIPKDEQASNWNAPELSENQINYAGLDAFLTWAIFKKLYPKIKAYESEKAYRLLREMQHVVADMELNGIALNKEKHINLIKQWEKNHEQASDKCRRLFKRRCTATDGSTENSSSSTTKRGKSSAAGRQINLNSGKQLGEWLKERYENSPEVLEAWPKTEKGAYSFNRQQLYPYKDDPAISAYLEYKTWEKLINTYGQSFSQQAHPLTGRIHCTFSIGQTRTGRLSSYAPNLQNLPRDSTVREVFTSSSRTSLIVADFSQIEIRVAAELSRDPIMLKAYQNSIDLHKAIVTKVIGTPYNEVTKDERQLGKAINFGLQFGMGYKKLRTYAISSYGYPMTEQEAQTAYAVYHDTMYPVYSAWCDKQRKRAEKTGFARTPLGRMRRLMESEVYTKAVNTPVQGGAAEVLMCAMVFLRKRIISENLREHIRILSTIHDEIILECDNKYVTAGKALLAEAMEKGLLLVFPDACLKDITEIGTGENWDEAKV